MNMRILIVSLSLLIVSLYIPLSMGTEKATSPIKKQITNSPETAKKNNTPAQKVIPAQKNKQNIEMKITFVPPKELEEMLQKITTNAINQIQKKDTPQKFVNIQDPFKCAVLPKICYI